MFESGAALPFWFGKENMTHVTVLVDLGYGDGGKGTMTDRIVRDTAAETVVRFSGGAQSAHTVVLSDGRHHSFAQFGSGTLVPGCHTYLSRHVIFDPLALLRENADLCRLGVSDALARLAVDEDALVVTPYHVWAGRLRELQRWPAHRHGSCGMGIWETQSFARQYPHEALRVKDLGSPVALKGRLADIRGRLHAELLQPPRSCCAPDPETDKLIAQLLEPEPAAEYFMQLRALLANLNIVNRSHLRTCLKLGPVVFEGSQGVLIDENFGFQPYVTGTTTTTRNATLLLQEAGVSKGVRYLGITRTHMARHGPGPLVTEDFQSELRETHNKTGPFQGPMRYGHLDLVALGYALKACGGLDGLAVTHLDTALGPEIRVCMAYRLPSGKTVEDLPFLLRPLFEHQGVQPAEQQFLTAALLGCKPVYRMIPPDQLLSVLAERLQAPVVYTSSGPTELDKKEIEHVGART